MNEEIGSDGVLRAPTDTIGKLVTLPSRTLSVGRIVLYRMNSYDCEEVNRRRKDAWDQIEWHRTNKTGAQVHFGNKASPGQVFPAVVVATWSTTLANLQVLLDGNDTFWATSRGQGDDHGQWQWPNLT